MLNIKLYIKQRIVFTIISFILFSVTSSFAESLILEKVTSCEVGQAAHSSSLANFPMALNEADKKLCVASPVANWVVSWVDNLNVRAASNTRGKVVTTVQPSDRLTLTGRKSNSKETIVLRGVAYYDYWFEVTTPKAIRGWVFGGAVKKPNEKKGNRVMTELNFDYPNFGAFDLSSWKYMGKEKSAEGDAESTGKVYKHPTHERTMIITYTNIGEYGYFIEHKLLGMNERPIKTRRFHYSNDERILRVEVTTHNIHPVRTAMREQEIKVSTYQINAKPFMVLGEWNY